VYPAGGRQGTTFRVTIGGQLLRNAEGLHITGTGVRATVLEYVRPLTNQELGQVARFLRDMVKLHWSVQALGAASQTSAAEPRLPDHPWLKDLNEQSPADIARLRARLFDPKKQPNAQIAEQVTAEVSIAADAPPGDRELRVITAAGLSNPVRFQVGTLPELREEDVPLDDPATVPADLPVVLNGQIAPGEVDRFAFRARQGQQLVVVVQARQLMPYLADAVPGWFQAVVALYDPQGNEVAYADDFRFDPDPVLHYQVPRDGVYQLEIRDAMYRGREDFVYRIAVGELPFVTSLFPLGAQTGSAVIAHVTGWNLPATEVALDTRAEGDPVRRVTTLRDTPVYGGATYAVDPLPECTESEPNDTPAQAQRVTLPLVINGRIDRPGDVDVFAFEGKAGDEIVADVRARRLNSPLDSALRIWGPDGTVVGLNDDYPDPAVGLITHQADSYLRLKLPADGLYQVQLVDVQGQGGEAYAYRLRLSAPQPDFALRAVPSSLGMPGRRPASLTVRALRTDGFDGEITVVPRQLPPGFALSAGRIAPDKDAVQLTLTPPRDVLPGVYSVELEGRAQIAGVTLIRPVIPAEDMMQAFAYHHLVPQQQLLVAVTGSRPVPAVWRPLVPGMELADAGPVRIPLGGVAQIRVRAPQTLPDRAHSPLSAAGFALCEPPRGIRLVESEAGPDSVTLTFKADANAAQPGRTGYLLVEVTAPAPGGTPAEVRQEVGGQRISLGILPGIPFEVVRSGSHH
jgi:catechol 2,3-dioxygenase-like lactoylglutathione lyase family enzyme